MRSSIWWTKSDYEDFKKAARLIARTIVTFGTEIWLKSNNTANNSIQDNDLETDFGGKWWCKYGHSRRGLEHLSNIQEGRNRQQCVKKSFKAVMDEQRRQKVNHCFNPERLATVSREYTAWAQDLAYAAGQADQLAVKQNFPVHVKDRNDFVLSNYSYYSSISEEKKEHFDGNILVGDVIGIKTPTPVVLESISKDSQLLDSFTHSNLVLKKHELKEEIKRRNSVDLNIANKTAEVNRRYSTGVNLTRKPAAFAHV